jgi:hypothetical protein
MTTTLTPAPATTPAKALVPFGPQGVQLATLEDAYRFANAVVKSGLAPKGMDTPEAVLVAIQLGAELGLTPMASLQNIAVINGRPGIFGDAALALVRSKDVMEQFEEKEIGERGKDTWGYRITTKRKGCAVAVEEFTVADAKTARLWGKPGPWTDYPKRMLKFRPRSYLLRDNYGDILKGLRTTEEIADMPSERNVTPPRGLAEALDAPPPSAEPLPEPPIAKAVHERGEILSHVQATMHAKGVTEEGAMKWTALRYPEEASTCERVNNLPTDVLVELLAELKLEP